MTARVVVLDYGIGNLRSVARALEHVGGEASVTGDAGEIARADALVIPGVGHVGACLRALRERDLVRPVLAFVGGGRPVVGVCVGMQLLFERSEESDDDGLALLPGVVRRLPESGAALRFEATDEASPIFEAEYSIDAKEWVRVEPDDGLSDSPAESYTIRLEGVPHGAYVLVRVTDAAHNVAAASFTLE
jgi:phosphoribosylformylglycinamidine (FGAM) synthase-like amidotransferase family enzyme